MRDTIPIILAALLIAFLSWNWGGVTTEGRMVAICGGVVIFMLVLFTAALRPSTPLTWNHLYFLPLILIISGGIVYLASPAPQVGKMQLFELISCSLLFSGLLLSRPQSGGVILFYILILLWGCFLTAYGIAYSGSNLLTEGILNATYVNRNHFCAFIGMIAPLALSFSLAATKRSLRWISSFGFMILLAGIILTKSRGGIVALSTTAIMVSIIYCFHKNTKKWGFLILIGLLLIVLLGGVLFIHINDPSRYTTSVDALSIQTRLSIWKSTLKMFAARPITGWGWGTFSFVYPQFKEPDVWYMVPHTHNEFLQFLGEGGIVGFLTITLALIWGLIRLINNFKTADDPDRRLFSLGSAGVFTYALVHSAFDFILRIPSNAFLLAAIAGISLSFSGTSQSGPGLISRRNKLAFALFLGLLLFLLIFSPLGKHFLADLEVRKAKILLREGNPREAREHFSRAVEIDTQSMEALYGRARADMMLFDFSTDKIRLYQSILADLGKARQINPWDTLPLLKLAVFHQRLGAYERAEDNFSEALSLDPTSSHLYLARGRNDLLRGDKKSAARNLNQASEIYPCVWPGALELLLSRATDYEILKDLPPPVDKFHRELGYKLLALKEWKGAEEEFKRAVELDPEETKNWRALGLLYSWKNDYIESRKAYKEALSLSPENSRLWSEFGEALKDMGQPEGAVICYRRAWKLNNQSPSLAGKAAALILKLEGNEAALTFWREVSRINPDWDRPHYHRAHLRLATGSFAQAQKEIERALELMPENPYYLKLRKKIDSLHNKNK